MANWVEVQSIKCGVEKGERIMSVSWSNKQRKEEEDQSEEFLSAIDLALPTCRFSITRLPDTWTLLTSHNVHVRHMWTRLFCKHKTSTRVYYPVNTNTWWNMLKQSTLAFSLWGRPPSVYIYQFRCGNLASWLRLDIWLFDSCAQSDSRTNTSARQQIITHLTCTAMSPSHRADVADIHF